MKAVKTLMAACAGLALFAAPAARADFTVRAPLSAAAGAPQKLALHYLDDGAWRFATCDDGEINPTRATCRGDAGSAPAADVLAAPRAAFGGGMDAQLETSRKWAVEMRRVDVRLTEVLASDLPHDAESAALQDALKRLSSRLADLDTAVLELKDQVARLGDLLAAHPDDADARAQLVVTQEKAGALTAQRNLMAADYAALAARLDAVRRALGDDMTFALLVSQRAAALSAHKAALDGLAAEQRRRLALERLSAYAADQTFTFRFEDAMAGEFPLEKAAARALHDAVLAGAAGALRFAIDPKAPQYTDCIGGLNPFCGIRASVKIAPDYALGRVSCRVVGAPKPCFELTFWHADPDNQLIALEGTTLGGQTDRIDWQGSARLPSAGTWVATAKCPYAPMDSSGFKFAGRIACEVQLRR